MPGRPRLTVLGSLNTDISVVVQRLPAPGETVLGSGAVMAPGGKGSNQAVAAARLGAEVRMVGCTGDDDFARMARSALQAEGVDIGGVRAVPGTATGVALITVDAAGENMITVASGANGEVGDAEATAALAEPSDLLVLSAEIPAGVIGAVLTQARAAGVTCLLNLAPAPADPDALLRAGVAWLVVNESEAAAVLGHPVSGLAEAGTAAQDLLGRGAEYAVVTAGAHGAALAGPDLCELIPALSVDSVDSVGAGDAFVAALGVALAAGVPPADAVRAASAAGATATTRRGTQDALPHPAGILATTGITWPVTPA
jgi:ribokinase